MRSNRFNSFLSEITLKSIFNYLFKWIIICLIVGILVGTTSSFFLTALNEVTQYREDHLWIIAFLPVGGLIIGLIYYYYGKSIVKGNDLLIEEYYNPNKTIPFKMAPLVLVGTLITHLFGGSAGREGTAVQMGGAIADQFTRLFHLNKTDRNVILIIGISSGFASIFGTPFTGAIFAIEILILTRINYRSVFPSLLAAFISNYVVHIWNVQHTHYSIPIVPPVNFSSLFWIIFFGILSGLTAMLFAKTTHLWIRLFSTWIKYPPFRPFMGGIIIALIVWLMGTTKYIGLGVPEIVSAFQRPNVSYDFLIKLLFTSFTLGAGFKGGEVTPLFFIGATLGSALSLFIPLPIALLAGMGFTAVFSGATNTPLACSIMGLELFGTECGLYITIACFTAYLCSGNSGIYHAQNIENSRKNQLFRKLKLFKKN